MIKDSNIPTWQTSENHTTQTGHTIPQVLDLLYQNGSDSIIISLSDPQVIRGYNPVEKSNVTLKGNPYYFRLAVDTDSSPIE